MPPRNPRRILARLGAYRTATPPTERSPARAHTCKPVRTRKINLTRASIHKTARDPIIVKDNAVIAADAVGPEDCRASEHAAIKKAPRLLSDEPLLAVIMKPLVDA